MRVYSTTPLIDRFWAQVQKTDTCWIWTGVRKKNAGYGRIKVRIGANQWRFEQAHRVSYEQFVGPIPDGLFVCHKCDNPSCVRHDHLFLGTPKENTGDMVAKGRRAKVAQGGMKNSKRKLNEDQVREIRKLHAAGAGSFASLGVQFGVAKTTVANIIWRVNWPDLD